MLLRVTTATVTVATQTGYLEHGYYELVVVAALAFGLALIAVLTVGERLAARSS